MQVAFRTRADPDHDDPPRVFESEFTFSARLGAPTSSRITS